MANQRDDLLITLDEVIGCEAVADLHLSRRKAQTLLAREMADGRGRELHRSYQNVGVQGQQHHIHAASEAWAPRHPPN